MMEVKHSAIIISLTLVLTTSLFAGFAVADGTHGVAVTIVNRCDCKIHVDTFNGKDKVKEVPHKVYNIDKGGTQKAKAHGQSTGAISIFIYNQSKGKAFTCSGTEGKKWNPASAKDKSTIEVQSCG